jgi:aromatic-L-amino-acid decarboxylase
MQVCFDESSMLLSAEAFTNLGHQVLALAQEFLYDTQRPIYRPLPDSTITRFRDAMLPAQGTSASSLLGELVEICEHATFGTNHRRSYGWVGGGVNEWTVLASLLATAINPNCLGGDQAITYLELATVRWLAELVGFPLAHGTGLLMSGGSQATLTALAAARQATARRLGRDVRVDGLQGLPKLAVYCSDQTHASVQQQANVLGLGELRFIGSDERFQIRVDALEDAIEWDRKQGLVPCCVVANAGTTNTGALDPLEQLADVCQAQEIWLHIDGAYGALGVLDERIRHRYRGIERADSVSLDSHKWLAAPYESGCLLVRDRRMLVDAFARPTPAYLLQVEAHPHFSELGFQLSRAPRALILWVLLRSLGRDGVRGLVRHHRDLALYFAAEVARLPHMHVLAPVLTTVCFRYEPPRLAGDEDQLRACNQAILADIQQSNLAFPAATQLGGRFALRACILHPRTSLADIQLFVQVLRAAVARQEEARLIGI